MSAGLRRPWPATTPGRRAAAAAALVVPVLLFAAPYLFSGRCVSGGDFAAYERIHAVRNRDALRRDGAPLLWAPYAFAGAPEYARFQGGEPWLYPPNALFLALPPDEAYEILFTLHILLAAAGMYGLARRHGLPRDAAVLAGLAYALGFMTTARLAAGHYGPFVTLAQAPLLLRLMIDLLRRPGRRRIASLAGAVALALASGQPGYLYHLALLGLALAAGRLGAGGAPWRRPAAALGAATALGVLLAAAFLLPAFETAFHSTRPPGGSVYGDVPVPRHHAFAPQNAVGFFIPFFSGTSEAAQRMSRDYWHEKSVYIGLLPLLCAAVALVRPRRPHALLLATAAAVALLDAMARDVPVHALLIRILPGYGAFRVPGRVVWITVLCLCLLAGMGWDALRRARIPGKALAAGVAAVLLPVAAVAAFRLGAGAEAVALLAFGAASLGVVALLRRRPAAAPAAAAALVAANLLVVGLPRQPTADPATVAAPPWYEARIGPERADYRVLDLTSTDLGPAAAGFRLLRGYGYPVPAGTAAYYARAWESPPPFSPDSLGTSDALRDPGVLDRLNVRWIVARHPLAPGWRELARNGDAALYESPTAFPAAFLAGGGSATLERSANRLRIRCEAAQATRLVVSESWMPGWTARSAGRELPLTRFEGALLETEVPAGRSEVEFVYAPASLRAGAWLSAATLAGLLLLALVPRRARSTGA
jgi:hypothetical protein